MNIKPEAETVTSTKPEAEKILQDLSGNGKFKHTLSRKVKVADKEYSELTVDFDGLTGEDMEAIAAMPGTIGGDAHVNELSKTYLMYFVARAAGITINELRKFPIADCTVLTMRAQTFLLSAVSNSTKN